MRFIEQFIVMVREMLLSVLRTSFGTWTNAIMSIIEIVVISYFVYRGIKLVREIRAGQLVKGILLIVGVWVLTELLELSTLSYLLKILIDLGAVAIIVVFQPELRRILEKVGTGTAGKLFRFVTGSGVEKSQMLACLQTVAEAAVRLSKTKTGALIVLERKTKLGAEIEVGGTILNADPSAELFCALFYEGNPLHDGAVIMRESKIYAAGCFLPLPEHSDHIPKELGSRHRAALGMSENSDAIVVVVSEETGMISTATNGNLSRSYNKKTLFDYLQTEMIEVETEASVPSRRTKRALQKEKKSDE